MSYRVLSEEERRALGVLHEAENVRVEWCVLDQVTGATHVFPSKEWAEKWARAHAHDGIVRNVQEIVTHLLPVPERYR